MPSFLAKLYETYTLQSQNMPQKNLSLTQALLEIAVVLGVVQANDVPIIDSEAARDLDGSWAADPTALKLRIDELSGLFHGHDQRDAHEFFRTLINKLHEELEDGTEHLYLDAHPLPTNEFFSFKLRQTHTCDNCDRSRSKDEDYWDFSVPVGDDSNNGNWSVQRSIEKFFDIERVQLNCENCEAGNTATRRLEIIRL